MKKYVSGKFVLYLDSEDGSFADSDPKMLNRFIKALKENRFLYEKIKKELMGKE